MTREKIFTVTIHDCTVQTYKASGPGGQKRNKTSSAVRVIHEPSGSRGECSEGRSQLDNKRTAFIRMTETASFKYWLHAVTNGLKTEAEIRENIMLETNDPAITITEVKKSKNEWVQVDPRTLKG